MNFYVIKNGECLTSFDNKDEAYLYAKKMKGTVQHEFENKNITN